MIRYCSTVLKMIYVATKKPSIMMKIALKALGPIGSVFLDFLDEYILRAEKSDAIPKLFIRNLKTNKEEEIKISNEQVGSPGASLMQRDTNTTKIRIGWESLATQGKVYE